MQKEVSNKDLQKEWEEIKAAQFNVLAFKVLYERYFETVFKFVYRRTTDNELTNDLCAQIFIKAIDNIKQYQFKGVPFSAWLIRIASNEVAQHYRNTQKLRVVSVDDFSLMSIIDEPLSSDKEDWMKALSAVLQTLNEQDMQLIELRFFEQRSFKEVAEIMQLTESNAKVRTYRTLQRLKEKILLEHSKQS